MSNYSQSPADCRVDFFKPSGKWYTTEVVKFVPGTYERSGWLALMMSLDAMGIGNPGGRFLGMSAVCLTPYVGFSYPVMVQIPEDGWNAEKSGF